MTKPVEEPTPWIVFDAPSNGAKTFIECKRCKAYLGFPNGYPVQKAEGTIWFFHSEHKSCLP